MTTIAELPATDMLSALRSEGLYVRFGPFVHRIRSDAEAIAEHLQLIYPDHVITEDDCAESTLTLRLTRNRFKPWIRLSRLYIDEQPFMYPLTADFCVPMLEWSMNWVVATRAHQFLLCHSAVVEKNGRVVVLPALSGSGKSTLCAMLVAAGWRLFSDEFAVIRLQDRRFIPMPRAVSLKNRSIDLARKMDPDAVITRTYTHTSKGLLAFMRAPATSVARASETAASGAIVFPRYDAEATLDARPLGKSETFREFILHCMNYGALGDRGFTCLADLVTETPAYFLRYGDNEKVMAWFEELAMDFK